MMMKIKNLKFKSILMIAAYIYFIEILIMQFFRYFPIKNQLLESFIDATSLTILSLPILYLVLVKKIININERIIYSLNERQKYLNLIAIISETDLDGTITHVNDKFCSLHGYTKEQLIGKTYSILHSGKHKDIFWENLWKKISTDGIWKGLICNKSKSGKLLWYESAIIPKKNSAGKTNGYISLKIDVTENKRNRDLLNHNAKLASLGLLAAGVAHEINNPLTIIKNLLNIAKKEMIKDGRYEGKRKQSVEKREAAIERIAVIVKGLTAHGRKGSIDFIKIDSHQIINSILPMFTSLYEKEGISIDCELNATHHIIHSREGKLDQVIINLLINAHDALTLSLEKKRKEKKIKIKTMNENGSIIILISDTGMGISDENQERIFDSFFTTKKIGKGTGLGLGISNSIVLEMNGRLSVKSELNEGSTFYIQLPFFPEDIGRSGGI